MDKLDRKAAKSKCAHSGDGGREGREGGRLLSTKNCRIPEITLTGLHGRINDSRHLSWSPLHSPQGSYTFDIQACLWNTITPHLGAAGRTSTTRSQGAQAGLSTPASSSCSGAQTQLEGATRIRATLPIQLGPAPGFPKKDLRNLLLSLVLSGLPSFQKHQRDPPTSGLCVRAWATEQP